MFEEFYGFSGKPFQLAPDPQFYFRSATHRKALSYLGYGLAQGEGFITITGEVGAGKSMLAAHLVATINPLQLTVGQIVTSALDGAEIVHVAARSFGLAVAGHDKASALAAIEAFLHDEARAGRRCLLMVDEAQNLSVEALEELRMLSNFQLGGHPLLQILLLGQPEFRTMLAQHPALEQLRQRVIAAHHLEPMEAEEVGPYVLHRLQQVGWNDNPSFDFALFPRLHAATDGVPRRINQIATRLLLLGALDQADHITCDMLRAVLDEMAAEQAPLAARTAEAEAPSAPMTADPIPATATTAAPYAGQSAGQPTAPAIDLAALDAMLAERDAQIAELQQAVVELHNKQDDALVQAFRPEIEALRAEIAGLDARSAEQERTIRQTLAMLIDWVESEIGQSKAA